jgi:hypothetical protein
MRYVEQTGTQDRTSLHLLLRGNGNDITSRNTPVGSPSVLVFVIFELDYDFLDHRRAGSVELPDWVLADFGSVEGCGLGEDGHAVGAFLEASFTASTQPHHMRPWQPNQLACVVLILNDARSN